MGLTPRESPRQSWADMSPPNPQRSPLPQGLARRLRPPGPAPRYRPAPAPGPRLAAGTGHAGEGPTARGRGSKPGASRAMPPSRPPAAATTPALRRFRGSRHDAVIGGQEVSTKGNDLDAAYQEATRYLVLINGGGAVAASTFLGGTIAAGHTMKWGVLPLGLFYFGLGIAGAIWLGNLYFLWIDQIEPEARTIAANKTFVTRIGKWIESRMGLFMIASFSCFCFGGASAMLVFLFG